MTYTKEQVRRDLNHHKAACVAMWFWSADYAASGLGAMGYWDRLSEAQKNMCRRAVIEIMARPDEKPVEHKGTPK